MEQNLLPCPLCGGDARHAVSAEHGSQNTVKCDDCGCRVSSQFDGCIEKWNTRATNAAATCKDCGKLFVPHRLIPQAKICEACCQHA